MPIEQTLHDAGDPEQIRCRARSPGFRDDWITEAERICAGFGERPAGASCPLAVFAQPFGRAHVAVGLATDTDRPTGLLVRLLIVPRLLYVDLGGDPFLIADAFPLPAATAGALPTLEWTADSPPRRSVGEMQKILDVPNSATLLGGAQALIDGSRLAFERTAPDPHLVRSLWALLPYSTRSELWPASYAFGNALGFDVAVVPRADGPDFTGYVFEEQAGDYPEGHYEHALQVAVESGDQGEIDGLFMRRSRSQTMKIAYYLLAILLLAPLVVVFCIPTVPRGTGVQPAPKTRPADKAPDRKPAEAPR